MPNVYGVYQPTESLRLPWSREKRRCGPSAEICLCHLEDGWLWSVSFQTGQRASSHGLSRRWRPISSSRAAAISEAVHRLRQSVAGLQTGTMGDSAVVNRILAWLDEIERQHQEPRLFDWEAE